jgi:uncharacterized protein YabN with tetrapyrrole methylase and pyrophosphatase domain
LRPFLLEETYEAIEAIDRGDMAELEGELGDVVFQCVFQAQIAFEAGRFEIADSINHIVEKLIGGTRTSSRLRERRSANADAKARSGRPRPCSNSGNR